MKIFHQIIILGLIGISLYVVRDDVEKVYTEVASYVTDTVIPSISKGGINSQTEKIANLAKSIVTPGALKATSSNELVADASKTKLSIKGVVTNSNQERAMNGGLPPLAENSKLNLSAKLKLDDMFKKQYFEHVSPSGTGVADLGGQVGYEYIIIGENLALGNFEDDKALVDAWMASPGHRANILNSHYTEIGVAVGHGLYEGRDTWLAVQHFGLPRSSCPAIDEVLHGQIDIEEQNIKAMGKDLEVRKERIDSGGVYDGMTTNEQIAKYNELVAVYNQMIKEMKEKVSIYNAQIRAFNACLEKTNTNASH